MPVRNDKPVNSGWMKLEDREYHKVYNTMSGVGLSGKLLPEDSRKKGRHWSVYVFALVCVGLLAWYFPRLFTEFTGKAIGGAVRSFSGGISKGMGLAPTNAVHPIVQLPANVPTERIRPAFAVPPSRPSPAEGSHPQGADDSDVPVYVSGMVKLDGVWSVFLTDGRRLSSKDIGMELLTSEGCKYEGKWYKLAHAMVDREKSSRNFGREEMQHESVRPAVIVPPAPVLDIPDDRMRKLTIHFQDGTTVTKLVRPSEMTGGPDVTVIGNSANDSGGAPSHSSLPSPFGQRTTGNIQGQTHP